jgi:site-specific DNA-cytosine methylase
MEDDVKKLAMLGVADKYRLADIKERLDMGKDLYISDKEFLENLSMVHLGRSLSRITKSQLVIDETVAEPVSDVREPEPEVVSEPEPVIHKPEPQLPEAKKTLAKKSRKQELEDYEKEYLNRAQRQPDTGGFTITEDGEVGKRVARKTKPRKKATAKTAKPRKKATAKTAKPRKKAKSKTDSCVKCGAKISTDDVFCINCGAKR